MGTNRWARRGFARVLLLGTLFQHGAGAQVLIPVQALFDSGLSGANALAISPDDAHLYATGDTGVVWVFARTPSGTAALIQEIRDGVSGLDGLGGARSVAVSPDGKNVYVAGTDDDALAVFDRDETLGTLIFAQALFDGFAGVDGLGGARSVVVGPSGRHVFVASKEDSALAVFVRSQNTGILSLLEAHFNERSGIAGLGGARSVSATADGKNVYVAGALDNALVTFSRNPQTGFLSLRQVRTEGVDDSEGLDGVNFAAVSPDGKQVYAISPGDPARSFSASISTYRRNDATGALTILDSQRNGTNGVQGLSGANFVAFSRGGTNAYVSSETDASLVVFTREPATGLLSILQTAQTGSTPAQPQAAVAVSNDGKNVYALSPHDGSSKGGGFLASYARSGSSGVLTFLEILRRGSGEVADLINPQSLAVSPDGAHVYAASPDRESLLIFARDGSTGKLTVIESHRESASSSEEQAPFRSIAVSPDGAHLYAAASQTGTAGSLSAFHRNTSTGRLTLIERYTNGRQSVNGLDGANCVIISPDGGNVYAASGGQPGAPGDNALTAFTRDPATGKLTFIQRIADGADGVNGLAGARCIAVSPDGKNIYVASVGRDSSGRGSVAVYARGEGGELTLVDFIVNGDDGATGLIRPASVAVSPDGAHVYIGSLGDPASGSESSSAVVLFSRQEGTGALRFVASEFDALSTEDGFGTAHSIALLPNGAALFATSEMNDALLIFARDTETGALTIVGSAIDGTGGVVGLSGPTFLAVSPDGAHLYAAGARKNAIQVFAVGGAGDFPGCAALSIGHSIPRPGGGALLAMLLLGAFTLCGRFRPNASKTQ